MPPTTLSYSVFGSQGPSGGRSSTPSRWKGMRPSTTVTCAPQEQRAPNTLSFGMPVRSPVSPSPPYGQGRSAIWPPPPSVVRASAVVAGGGPSIHTPSVVTGSDQTRRSRLPLGPLSTGASCVAVHRSWMNRGGGPRPLTPLVNGEERWGDKDQLLGCWRLPGIEGQNTHPFASPQLGVQHSSIPEDGEQHFGNAK